MRRSIFVLSLLLAACSGSFIKPHKIDVQQGNFVDQEMISKLKPGMTRSQVRFALGTPLVADAFHAERWDYIYRFQKGGGAPQQRQISVIFEDDKLARVEGDVVAAKSEPAQVPQRSAAQVSTAKPAEPPAPPKPAVKAPPPEPEPGLTTRLGRMLGFGSDEDAPKQPVMLKREEREPAVTPAPKLAAAEAPRREPPAEERAKPKPAPQAPADQRPAPASRKPWDDGGKKAWEDGAKPWESDGKLRNREGKTIGEQLGELFDFGGGGKAAEAVAGEKPVPKDGKLRNREGKTIAEQIRDLFRTDTGESPKAEAPPTREAKQRSTEPSPSTDGKLRNREGKTIGEQIRDLFRSGDTPVPARASPEPSTPARAPSEPSAPASAEPTAPVTAAEPSTPAGTTAESSEPARTTAESSESPRTTAEPGDSAKTTAEPSSGSGRTQAESTRPAQASSPKASEQPRVSAKEGKGFLRFFIEDILGFDEEWRSGEWQGPVK